MGWRRSITTGAHAIKRMAVAIARSADIDAFGRMRLRLPYLRKPSSYRERKRDGGIAFACLPQPSADELGKLLILIRLQLAALKVFSAEHDSLPKVPPTLTLRTLAVSYAARRWLAGMSNFQLTPAAPN